MSTLLHSDLNKVDPVHAWQPWEPGKQQPWSTRWAAHLFRRAVFGASPEEVENAVKAGLSPTLDRLLKGGPETAERDELLADMGEELARENDVFKLRGWWLYAMLQGGHPLREKLTLFWHNHFATSIVKVLSTLLMFQQNQLIRKHALGKFGPFLGDISRDPAMLIWLDSNQNVKAHPNENYAREVMELFSLGVGNYTEKDVREAARAFTGWHTDSSKKRFAFQAAEHDNGSKTILGRTGNLNGDDVLKLALEQPACARFLVGKFYHYLVSETPPPKALLEPLAERLRKSDYNIADLVETILRSRLFFSEHAHLKRIRSPVEFALGTVKAAWPGPVSPSDLVLSATSSIPTVGRGVFVEKIHSSSVESLGQSLFAPPNVKGWLGGKSWLNEATILARNNFAEWVVNGKTPFSGGTPPPLPEQFLLEEFKPVPVPPAPPGPVVPAAPAVPAPPGPPENFDVALYTRKHKATTPKDIVARLAEQFLPGGINPQAAKKLEAFIADGNPKDKHLNHRIREVAHAIMCMPEYQLC